MAGFSTPGNSLILWTPAGCPTVQFSSDIAYPELAAESTQVKGSVPQNCPLPQLQTPTASLA